jgi:hypothetical protein
VPDAEPRHYRADDLRDRGHRSSSESTLHR